MDKKEKFSAEEYFQKHNNDYDLTIEDILNEMNGYTSKLGITYSTDDIKVLVAKAEDNVKTSIQTVDKYRISGEKDTAEYIPERQEKHIEILENLILSNVEKFTNTDNKQPTLIMLGGRPGSGKTSGFKNLVYDDDFVIIDADYIKSQLPEYKGYNAQDLHEESTDIVEQALRLCKENKLNIVVETTMGSTETAKRRIADFQNHGYKVETHYMFLPIHKAATRAVERFLNGGDAGRYLPIGVILSMKTNEQNFDKLKEIADAWSFYANNSEGKERKIDLIAESDNSYIKDKRKSFLYEFEERSSESNKKSSFQSRLDNIRNKIKKLSKPENCPINIISAKIKDKLKKGL